MTYDEVKQVAIIMFGLHPDTPGDLNEIFKVAQRCHTMPFLTMAKASLCAVLAGYIDKLAQNTPEEMPPASLRDVCKNSNMSLIDQSSNEG